jgi:hypothetical protein
MRSVLILGACLAMHSTPAMAQLDFQGATAYGTAVNPVAAAQQGAEAGYRLRAMREAQQAAEQQAQDRQIRVNRAQRVGALMATGDCPGAKNLALAEGDFDMAGKVMQLCAPSPGR